MLKVKKKTQGNQPTAKNWYSDKYQSVLVQRNIFAVITLLSLLTTLVAVIAVKSLSPLKSVEPFVIQIDEKTGLTEVVEPLSRSKLVSANEVVDNYFVWQYIRARETYDIPDYSRNVQIVNMMSHNKVYSSYVNEISPNNPQSAVARLGKKGVRTVENPVIIYLPNKLGKRMAQVRFQISESQRGERAVPYQKIVTMEFTYADIELTRAQRFINPLGFQVISYRIEDATVR